MEMTHEALEAVRGIRANFLPRRVKVFNRPEWGCLLVKAGGEAWIVDQFGTIIRLADQVGVKVSL